MKFSLEYQQKTQKSRILKREESFGIGAILIICLSWVTTLVSTFIVTQTPERAATNFYRGENVWILFSFTVWIAISFSLGKTVSEVVFKFNSNQLNCQCHVLSSDIVWFWDVLTVVWLSFPWWYMSDSGQQISSGILWKLCNSETSSYIDRTQQKWQNTFCRQPKLITQCKCLPQSEQSTIWQDIWTRPRPK